MNGNYDGNRGADPRRESGRATDSAAAEIAKRVVGMESLVESLMIAIVAGGHTLVEGVPGIAKTMLVKTLAETCDLHCSRIQFTPDLLPSDIIGTLIYNPSTSQFTARKGPIFANVVIADEINRAPAKVQSALLEAMEERKVTIGNSTIDLPDPFFVMATQNPIEHEGTYQLPEAQVDRFLFKLRAQYPDPADEVEIVRRTARQAPVPIAKTLTAENLKAFREGAESVELSNDIADYIVRLARVTRLQYQDELVERHVADVARYVEYGVSPRAAAWLGRAARARAYLAGRNRVAPDDVKALVPDVFRHRIGRTYEAEADRVDADRILAVMLQAVPLP